MHSKVVLDVLRERVNLKGQVAPPHGIQKIKSDRELVSKTRVHRLTQQRARLIKYEVNCWDLNQASIEIQQQTVLLRHAVETPTVIVCAAIQIANFFHPL